MKYREAKGPPDRWQDFEDLCLGIWRRRLVDAKKHGRTGQPQSGVDVYGRDPQSRRWVGVQCKQKGIWPPKSLSDAQIEDEVELAESFEPKLSKFIIATTARRDVSNQEFVRKLTETREEQGKFSVDLYAWDDLEEWLHELAESPPDMMSRRHDFFRHISIPVHYVTRSALVESIVSSLLIREEGDKSARSAAISCLHGMGGIGKSVLARAVCEDDRIHRKFHDGALWVTLGKTPNLEAKLGELLELFGCPRIGSTLDLRKAQLANLLQGRACFLVLDDLWYAEHAETFRVCGPRSHLLVTTRDAEIAREVFGATIHRIPSMSDGEAGQVLDAWSGGRFGTSGPKLRQQIIERCGGIPLALRLAGAQLESRDPEVWLQEFELKTLALRDAKAAHESMETTLELSFDSLTERQKELLISLAIFKEDEQIPVRVVALLWHQLLGIEAAEAQGLVSHLASKALIESTEELPGGEIRGLQLHDLVRDFLGERLGERELEAVHSALLGAYGPGASKRQWHDVEDDGYLYEHLAYHLVFSGRLDELRQLFDDDRWLMARVMADGYDYAGYLSDLGLAWHIALASIEEDRARLSEVFAYGLIETSIGSIALNYSPQLVSQALKEGHWQPEKGLRVAERVPYHFNSVELLMACLESGAVDAPMTDRILSSALIRYESVTEVLIEGETLVLLWPHIPDVERSRLAKRLPEMLSAALQRDGYNGLFRELVELTANLEDGDSIRAPFRDSVVASIRAGSPKLVSELAPTLPYLGGGAQREILRQIFAGEPLENSPLVLISLVDELDRGELIEALELVPALGFSKSTLELLVAIARRSEGALFELAVEQIEAWVPPEAEPEVLEVVLPLLEMPAASGVKQWIFRDCLTAIRAWRQDSDSWDLLAGLARLSLSGESSELWKELELAKEFVLSRTEVRNILVSEGLRCFAPWFSEDELDRALDLALADAVDLQGEKLSYLAPFLQGPRLSRALDAASRIGDELSRSRLYAAFAERLGGSQDLYQRAAEAALTSRSADDLLLWLLKALPADMAQEAWRYSADLSLADRLELLVSLIPSLDDSDLVQYFSSLESTDHYRFQRRRVLEQLLPSVAESSLLHPRLLSEVETLWSEDKARLLCRLTPNLISAENAKFLDDFRKQLQRQNAAEMDNIYGAAELLPLLGEEQRHWLVERFLEKLGSSDSTFGFGAALQVLLPQLTEVEVRPFGPAILEHCFPGGRLNSSDELEAKAILEAGAKGLPEESIDECLKRILELEDSESVTLALSRWAPRLDSDQLEYLFREAVKAESYTRAAILGEIGAFLDDELVPAAWSEAARIENAESRNWAMLPLIAKLRGPGWVGHMAAWLHSSRIEERGHFLYRCAESVVQNPCVPEHVLEDMAKRSQEIIESWQWP